MRDSRPDPEALLREVQRAEERLHRGKLKLFLGAAAGVGKTYAMVSEAQEQRERGVDVIAGIIETHGRRETDAAAEGLDRLPLREIEHRGVTLNEFDLDGALARKPELILVDELAHTNAPGSRHAKRWQDIEELLRAGINVYTAVNIQHVESLNDAVNQITGVPVRETVPDAFIEQADEIELIDLPPEELMQRIKEGKVYVPQQIERALHSFFRKGNLLALRQLALRHTAERVEAEMQSYRTREGVRESWQAGQRILVCIAPSRMAERLVRTGRRLATAMHSEARAIYVERPQHLQLSEQDRQRAYDALRLAEELGMETATLSGNDIVAEVLRYARQHNFTIIVTGKPLRSRLREFLFGSVSDELVRHSGDIDVYTVTDEGAAATPGTPVVPRHQDSVWAYVSTVAITAASTGIASLLHGRVEPANLIMVFLLGVAVAASRYGVRQAVLAAVLSVAAFDFLFVPPHFSFAVSDTQYLITFFVMLVVALLIGGLTYRSHLQAEAAGDRAMRTATLYAFSRELSKSWGEAEMGAIAAAKIGEVFDGEIAILLGADDGTLTPIHPSRTEFEGGTSEVAVAQWVFEHSQPAGYGTATLPGAQGLYLPLKGARGVVGVLCLRPSEKRTTDPLQMQTLEAFASQLAVAAERSILATESHEAQLRAEKEKLRSSLLSSVSHDLRTPLTSIEGAASALAEDEHLTPEARVELARTIEGESQRLNRLVRNLLSMTRLESGGIRLRREWQSLEELVGSAIERTKPLLGPRTVKVSVPEDVPFVRLDGVLVEQVLVNLLENAARYTPETSEIEITAMKRQSAIRLEVADRGPGVPKGEEERVFDKFYRASRSEGSPGAGLGLAICRAVMQAHGGRIWVRNRPGGGAVFALDFPTDEPAPAVPSG